MVESGVGIFVGIFNELHLNHTAMSG
jgi:hypothetical protein